MAKAKFENRGPRGWAETIRGASFPFLLTFIGAVAVPSIATACDGTIVRSCGCPADSSCDKCEKVCSIILGDNGRCLYKCDACDCASIGTHSAGSKWSCLAGLLVPSVSAEEGPKTEKSFRNEDGDFIVMDATKAQGPSDDEAGIGVRVVQVSSAILVGSVMENGPAARGGLKPGDEIIKIDGRSCRGMSIGLATKSLRGRSGTLAVLSVRSKETGKVRKFSFNRAPLATLLSTSTQKQKVTVKDVQASNFSGDCPKEHQGCHFLYKEKEKCTYTCSSQN